MRTLALLVSLLAGCAGNADPVYEIANAGRACVWSPSSSGQQLQQFLADQPIVVTYSADTGCLSSSCTRIREQSCTIVASGSTHVVTSRFHWVDVTQSAGVCTDDCSGLAATCETDALPAGTYELRFSATASVSITIPSLVPTPPCVDVTE